MKPTPPTPKELVYKPDEFRLNPGQTLTINSSTLIIHRGLFKLERRDGSLVGKIATSKRNAFVVFRRDGNLYLVDPRPSAIVWSSTSITQGQGKKLVVKENSLIIYGPGNRVLFELKK